MTDAVKSIYNTVSVSKNYTRPDRGNTGNGAVCAYEKCIDSIRETSVHGKCLMGAIEQLSSQQEGKILQIGTK